MPKANFPLWILVVATCGCASFSPPRPLADREQNSGDARPATNRLASRESEGSGSAIGAHNFFAEQVPPSITLRMQSEDPGPPQQLDFFFEEVVLEAEDFEPNEDESVEHASWTAEFWSDARSDFRNFYSIRNLPLAAAFLGTGAWLANSDLDQNILEHVQDNITFNSRTNEYQEFVGEFRFFGEGYFLLPVYAGTAFLGKRVLADHPRAAAVGDWADRCFRGILIGAPPLMVTQWVIGGSRPGESPEQGEGSEWQFMNDNNGVSGHAFMGAVPFLTAYHMTDRIPAKLFYLTASTLPALSRITENGHYPSQALLGWGLAYFATSSVARTERGSLEVSPLLMEKQIGLGLTWKY